VEKPGGLPGRGSTPLYTIGAGRGGRVRPLRFQPLHVGTENAALPHTVTDAVHCQAFRPVTQFQKDLLLWSILNPVL
jgi:hypothetical protein